MNISITRNRILYTILLVAVAVSLWVIGLRLPLLYPHSYFAHQKSYEDFRIYSDQPIDVQTDSLIHNVRLRMKYVEDIEEGERYSVFLCHQRSCYEPFARMMGINIFSQGLTIEPMGYVMINLYDIRLINRIYRRDYPYTLAQGDPSHIIVHELAHLLTTERLGIWRSSRLPTWKKEGYAEYAASRYPRMSNPYYKLSERIQKYFNGYYLGVSKGRKQYIEAGLAVEYLLDQKGIAFRALMAREIDYKSILKEMKSWASSTDSH